MPNYYYSITNQKLHFAKLALEDWQSLEKSQQFNKVILRVYQERVIFHLYVSLWAIYNEIAAYYRFPLLTQPLILSDFLNQDLLEKYPSPEFNELALLLETPSSAVASINKAWLDLFSPLPIKEYDVNEIRLKEINTYLGIETLQSFLKELTDLISHFRCGLIEY